MSFQSIQEPRICFRYGRIYGISNCYFLANYFIQQIETATQELAEISPTLHSIANLRIGTNSNVQPATQITLEFTGKELVDTAGPEPFVEPFTEPSAETGDISASMYELLCREYKPLRSA